jgi:hypothetical protein
MGHLRKNPPVLILEGRFLRTQLLELETPLLQLLLSDLSVLQLLAELRVLAPFVAYDTIEITHLPQHLRVARQTAEF